MADVVQVPGVTPQDEATARKGERYAALCFLVAFLGGIGFVVSYVVFQVGDIEKTQVSNLALGGTLTLALLGLAAGLTTWVRLVMPKYNLVQERHPMASDTQTRSYVAETFLQGANESGIAKRPLLRRTLLAAAAPLGLAPLVLLRDLGPSHTNFPAKLRHTVWGEKTKDGKPRKLIVEGSGSPIRAADFNSPAASSPWCPRATSTT